LLQGSGNGIVIEFRNLAVSVQGIKQPAVQHLHCMDFIWNDMDKRATFDLTCLVARSKILLIHVWPM
jgi:hypothetical protein